VLEFAELALAGALDDVPAPIAVPAEFAAELAAGLSVALEDAEGTPVASLRFEAGLPRLSPLKPFSHGPARSARRTPAQLWAELGQPAEGRAVLAVPVTTTITVEAVDAAGQRAAETGEILLWLAVFGAGRPGDLPAAALWRAVRTLAAEVAARGISSVAVAVAVPLLTDPAADSQLVASVARAYGGNDAEVADPLEIDPFEDGTPHPIFVHERERAVLPPHRRGVTVFFTGLSGSGKSTVAKALAEQILEQTARTVSLLDGDEVRRLLSAGLSFSRADRDLNIRRIGFVATEVSRHGGLAICAPIAPFAAARDQVRAAVAEVGDFVLVHVSTPLAECERRDRKGLYAKAREGLIPDFTGISSPYEVPLEADLRLDTSRLEVAEAVQAVWALLAERGYLGRPGPLQIAGGPLGY
jgi:sulfate adenylyltransferase